MQLAQLLLAACITLASGLTAAADESPVVAITEDNFDEKTKTGEWLITISAPW